MDNDFLNPHVEDKEGIVVETSPLELNIDDELLKDILDQRTKISQNYYRDELGLDKRIKENEKYWLGKQISEKMQKNLDPYVDNLIWQDSEKRIEIAAGRMPDIILTPPNNDPIKKDNTKLVEKALQVKFNSSKIKRIIKDGLRLQGINFIAIIKAVWKPDMGENGDYAFELVKPSRFGMDHTGTISHDGFTIDNIDLTWELIEEPLVVTLKKFPKKAQELRDRFKVNSNPKSLVTKIQYKEYHFTWYQNDGTPMECVAWKYLDIILDKQKTPYFDYTGYTKRVWDQEYDQTIPDSEVSSSLGKYYRNHFDRPHKNYILFSYQNLMRSPYDDTTPIEQAIPLQRSVNRRARQITDIADKMKPRFIFNNAIDKGAAEDIINNDNPVWADTTEPVTNIVSSFQSQPPSPMLFNDLVANRGQIDSKFSTHGSTRGEVQSTGESGISKQISREGDLVTSDDIVDIMVERVVYEMANWALQLMKLYYDKSHYVRDMGQDGEVVYQEMTRDLIEDGILVNVKASSTDKVTRRNDAFNLAKVQAIDPLSMAEDMDMPNPKERTRRLLSFLQGPQDGYTKYMSETGLAEEDEQMQGAFPQAPGMPSQGGFGQPKMMDGNQARNDLQQLINGVEVRPSGVPGPDYVQFFAQYVNSEEFVNMNQMVQNKIVEYVRQLQEIVNQQATAGV